MLAPSNKQDIDIVNYYRALSVLYQAVKNSAEEYDIPHKIIKRINEVENIEQIKDLREKQKLVEMVDRYKVQLNLSSRNFDRLPIHIKASLANQNVETSDMSIGGANILSKAAHIKKIIEEAVRFRIESSPEPILIEGTRIVKDERCEKSCKSEPSEETSIGIQFPDISKDIRLREQLRRFLHRRL